MRLINWSIERPDAVTRIARLRDGRVAARAEWNGRHWIVRDWESPAPSRTRSRRRAVQLLHHAAGNLLTWGDGRPGLA